MNARSAAARFVPSAPPPGPQNRTTRSGRSFIRRILRVNEFVDDAHRETELPRNGPVRAPRGPQLAYSEHIRESGHLPPAPRGAALIACTVSPGRGPCLEALRAAGRLPIRQPREEEKEELPLLRGRPRAKEGLLEAVVAEGQVLLEVGDAGEDASGLLAVDAVRGPDHQGVGASLLELAEDGVPDLLGLLLVPCGQLEGELAHDVPAETMGDVAEWDELVLGILTLLDGGYAGDEESGCHGSTLCGLRNTRTEGKGAGPPSEKWSLPMIAAKTAPA